MDLGVDKKACLEILDRGLITSYTYGVFTDPELKKREFFRGPAKNCLHYHDPDFRKIMEEHEIKPETWIAVAAMGNPSDFAVIKV